MRTLRAVYNHARRTNRELPAENPVGGIDWNGEKRRDTGMGLADLKGWFTELAAIENPTYDLSGLVQRLQALEPEFRQVEEETRAARKAVGKRGYRPSGPTPTVKQASA